MDKSFNKRTSERIDFKRLFNLYYPRLILFAGKYLKNLNDAEDCVLESFSSFWENREKIENPERVKSYLYSSVRNRCLNMLRHNQLRQIVDIENGMDVMDDTSVELSIIDSELHAMLLQAICNLPEDARLVLELNTFEKLKLHEIAQEMDCSLNHVKALKTKALRELKKELGDKFLIISLVFGLI